MLLPPLSIAAAIGGCVLFPIILLLLSHGPLKVTKTGRRFFVAWMALLLIWLIASALFASGRIPPADLLAGLSIFGGAILCTFMVWSVLCWGFTLNMLMSLGRVTRAGSLADWQRAFAGEAGLSKLAADRAGVLLRAGFARARQGDAISQLTPLGISAHRLVHPLSKLLAVDR
jgi:hypothetical protein